MSNSIIDPSGATASSQAASTRLQPGYNPSLGPIQLPASYQLQQQQQQQQSKKPTIYDTSLSRRTPEVNLSSLAFLFMGMVQYSQTQSKGIQQLESSLNTFGYGIGQKTLELLTLRDGKAAKRGLRIVEMLQFIHTNVWRSLFGKTADQLEKSSGSEDEYMITDNNPIVSQFISVPKEYGQLNLGAFMGGIIEGILDSAYFKATVTAHGVETEEWPLRTVFLVKFEKGVIEREHIRFGK
jgi:hypothetical protein